MSVIQGHERYACKVYCHEAAGTMLFDSSVVVDTEIDEEFDFRPGLFGIGEAVYCFAEEEALEVAEPC